MLSQWDLIRAKARAQREIVQAEAGGSEMAEALLLSADSITGFTRVGVPAGDPLLDGGESALDVEARVIWYNRELEPELMRFYQSHEYAHLWIDGESAVCSVQDLEIGAFDSELPIGVQRVEGYSPEERHERAANIYAREFLLPSELVRNWFINDELGASAIAEKVGVPDGIVFHQLTRAMLGVEPNRDDQEKTPEESEFELDPSQQEAAHIEQGPFLLEAGPGTGKTRALVGRILFLLEKGVTPDSILALTFSNRAAEEMRIRIAQVQPDAAARIWMGTFHAFGLEVLRKFGAKLGLPARPAVLDPIDALFLLERELPSLKLDHYQNLYEPTTYLRDMLQAISRAKDELVGPTEYAELADRMHQKAKHSDELEVAEKAQEVAQVYAYYQTLLEREHLLDFGDLIFQAVILLRSFSDVKEQIRQTYSHILVDEYQDVNRASGLLLKELVGSGAGLWVVGDARQSIYRFRGAAPINLSLFATDFPDSETRSLKYNYRSRPAIVRLFSAIVPIMKTSQELQPVKWQIDRDDLQGTVMMEVAEDAEAEGYGIAREIKRQQEAGTPYRDQAVLCRSHSQLAQVASCLEQANVPVLSLGNLFERPEIRDLLSLLSLAGEGGGQALVRVARFHEYNIPLEDVLKILTFARERDLPFPKALTSIDDALGISEDSLKGLSLLVENLQDISYGSNAWGMLVRYLFDRSNYVRLLLRDETVAGQQKRLAVLQLLQLAYERREVPIEESEDPKRVFLRYVRKLEWYGAARQLRQLPDAADSIDAVRLLTVHAAKGLEFDVVFVSSMGRGRFPASRQWIPCPPPEGMLTSERDEHEEEEECLFFVALSRARDVLCLSRARCYGRSNSKPADILLEIADQLPHSPDGPVTWRNEEADPGIQEHPVQISEPGVHPLNTLEVYMRCPRQYFYEFVLGLGGRGEATPYVLFHRSVHRVLHWLRDEKEGGREVNVDGTLARLDEIWAEQGPVDHPYESIYRQQAEEMVRRATRPRTGYRDLALDLEWEILLEEGAIRFRPDRLFSAQEGSRPTVFPQRLRTGRQTKGEADKDIYALYVEAARNYFPEAEIKAQVVHLSTDEVQDVSLSTRTIETRLGHYRSAMNGIRRREFTPTPSERICPQCPYYFICPVAEDR